LDARTKLVKLFRLPRVDGMVPDKVKHSPRNKVAKLVISPIELGIVPVRLLTNICKKVRPVIFPIEFGIVPVRPDGALISVMSPFRHVIHGFRPGDDTLQLLLPHEHGSSLLSLQLLHPLPFVPSKKSI
jgi:hypothetical protein